MLAGLVGSTTVKECWDGDPAIPVIASFHGPIAVAALAHARATNVPLVCPGRFRFLFRANRGQAKL